MNNKEMEDKELWMKKLKDKLEDYSEPMPASGWERLEKALPSSAPVRPLFLRRKWAVAAAAAVLVAVSTVSLLFLYTPAADEMRNAVAPALAVAPDSMPGVVRSQSPQVQQQQVQQKQAQQQQVATAQPSTGNSSARSVTERTSSVVPSSTVPSSAGGGNVAQNASLAHATQQSAGATHSIPEVSAKEPEAAVGNYNALAVAGSEHSGKEAQPSREAQSQAAASNNQAAASNNQAAASNNQAAANKRSVPANHRPTTTANKNLTAYHRPSSTGKGWSVGMGVGNIGLPSLDEAGTMSPSDRQVIYLDNFGNAIGIGIPSDMQMFANGEVPYMADKNRVVSADHKQPISVGLSIRKQLTKRLTIESGLMYTYLASELVTGTNVQRNQKLHYLGIPLKAGWTFYHHDKLTIYGSGGGAVERCIYGKLDNEKLSVDAFQFSVSGGVGAQLNVSKRVGLYVEPGVVYYFDDGSAVETIRKEKPFNFNLQAGLRLTY